MPIQTISKIILTHESRLQSASNVLTHDSKIKSTKDSSLFSL